MQKFFALAKTVFALTEVNRNDGNYADLVNKVENNLEAFKDEYLAGHDQATESEKDKAIAYLYRAIEIFRASYAPGDDELQFHEDYKRAFRLVEVADELLDLVTLAKVDEAEDKDPEAVGPSGR